MSNLVDQIFISPSPEFIAICQSQIVLLTKGLGATSVAVYLTENLVKNRDTQLVPVVAYPSSDIFWQQQEQFLSLPDVVEKQEKRLSFIRTHQIVLPLIYQEMVMGLLIAKRDNNNWNSQEMSQIEQISTTLALARILDLRQGNLKQQLNKQKNLRIIEHNKLDDLLHQLRNPLTALRTFSKLLLKRFKSEDPNYKVATSMLTESDRLQELLQQFQQQQDLTLPESDISSGTNSSFLIAGDSLSLEFVNINEVLDSIIPSSVAIATEKGINLTYFRSENIPHIEANFQALREVLNNLIDNALKYTPSGGSVEITLIEESAHNPPRIGISIADTGLGIPTEIQKNLFQRHYRGIQAESDISGNGLGLAIAKQLIEQMSGSIELISPNPASKYLPGSVFKVWLKISSSI